MPRYSKIEMFTAVKMEDAPVEVIPGIGTVYGARVAVDFKRAEDLYRAYLACDGKNDLFKLILKRYRMRDDAMEKVILGFTSYYNNHGTNTWNH